MVPKRRRLGRHRVSGYAGKGGVGEAGEEVGVLGSGVRQVVHAERRRGYLLLVRAAVYVVVAAVAGQQQGKPGAVEPAPDHHIFVVVVDGALDGLRVADPVHQVGRHRDRHAAGKGKRAPRPLPDAPLHHPAVVHLVHRRQRPQLRLEQTRPHELVVVALHQVREAQVVRRIAVPRVRLARHADLHRPRLLLLPPHALLHVEVQHVLLLLRLRHQPRRRRVVPRRVRSQQVLHQHGGPAAAAAVAAARLVHVGVLPPRVPLVPAPPRTLVGVDRGYADDEQPVRRLLHLSLPRETLVMSLHQGHHRAYAPPPPVRRVDAPFLARDNRRAAQTSQRPSSRVLRRLRVVAQRHRLRPHVPLRQRRARRPQLRVRPLRRRGGVGGEGGGGLCRGGGALRRRVGGLRRHRVCCAGLCLLRLGVRRGVGVCGHGRRRRVLQVCGVACEERQAEGRQRRDEGGEPERQAAWCGGRRRVSAPVGGRGGDGSAVAAQHCWAGWRRCWWAGGGGGGLWLSVD
eukprot:Rhum_TRINITY_DN13721_c2_g1::Rhum_TRINITY_DN13721_c2_g1_i1::g.63186::m.63186